MKKYLLIVEPMRLRAVQRWLDNQSVLLVCSREFVAPRLGARAGRPSSNPTPKPPRDPDFLRTLFRPALYRGRAVSFDKLIERCPELAQVSAGDLLIAPNLPQRGTLSVHRVAASGPVVGSSATTALPLGFTVSKSFIVDVPLVADAAERVALAQSLPMPAGPLTPLPQLGPLWDAFVAGLPA